MMKIDVNSLIIFCLELDQLSGIENKYSKNSLKVSVAQLSRRALVLISTWFGTMSSLPGKPFLTVGLLTSLSYLNH
jgi:hypothetical protein